MNFVYEYYNLITKDLTYYLLNDKVTVSIVRFYIN